MFFIYCLFFLSFFILLLVSRICLFTPLIINLFLWFERLSGKTSVFSLAPSFIPLFVRLLANRLTRYLIVGCSLLSSQLVSLTACTIADSLTHIDEVCALISISFSCISTEKQAVCFVFVSLVVLFCRFITLSFAIALERVGNFSLEGGYFSR